MRLKEETDKISTFEKDNYIHCKFKGGSYMSLLEGILMRLKNLQEDPTNNERYFEVNGKKKCKVSYFNNSQSYELKIFNDNGNSGTFQFDDMDMAAIEIFDLLQGEKEL